MHAKTLVPVNLMGTGVRVTVLRHRFFIFYPNFENMALRDLERDLERYHTALDVKRRGFIKLRCAVRLDTNEPVSA